MMEILLLFLSGALAWFISTIAAGGAASLLLPLVAYISGPTAVAPVLAIASLIANPTRAWLFRHQIDTRALCLLLPGTLLGVVLGSKLLSQLDGSALEFILGLFLLANFFAHFFLSLRLPHRLPKWLLLPAGFTVAAISAVIGATGPVLNPVFFSVGVEKEHLVATKAINSLLMQLSKIFAYSWFGLISSNILFAGAAIGIGAIAGIYIAKARLEAIDTERFRDYAHGLMGCVGSVMLYRGWAALIES